MRQEIDAAIPERDHGLFGRLRTAAAAEWDAYVNHRFVRALADGSLPPSRFRHFLQQDYLYLLQYARASALAVVKAGTLEEMRDAATPLSALLNDELSLHLRFCAGWGMDQAGMDATRPSLETLAYGGFIMDRAQNGDMLDLACVLSACLVGYAEAGLRLAADPAAGRPDNPYREWIACYSGTAYVALARDGIRRLNRLGEFRGAGA